MIENEGKAIGNTSINEIDWVHGSATTGTMIGDKSAWGKGIGGEQIRLRANFAFRELPLRKLMSAYIEGNEASRRPATARSAGSVRTSSGRAAGWTG